MAIFGGVLLIRASIVHAGQPLSDRLKEVGDNAGFDTTKAEFGLSQYIGSIINGIASLLGTIFFAQMVYAGYQWMTAAGDAKQVEDAKNIIKRSIVGLAVVLGAWAITIFVTSALYNAR